MTRAKPDDGLSKFQRYRRAQKRDGMKLLRIWVPDPSTPEFQAEVARQAEILNGAEEDEEALRFIESVMEWPEP